MNIDRDIANLQALVEILSDPAKLAAYERAYEARREQRIANHAKRVRAMVARITAIQDGFVQEYKRQGATVNKYFRDRYSDNVAVMLTKQGWNSAKGRIGTKIIMVYPDGTRAETFERTISIKKSF